TLAKPLVAVIILPQRYFVERIAGDRFRTMAIVGPGQSPHSYEPSPRQMADLSRASAWFVVGVEFERALTPKISSLYPSLRIVDTAANVVFRRLDAHDHEAEGNGAEGNEAEEEHDEEAGADPHIWLGRASVAAQALIIRDELIRLDPAGEATFTRNFDAFMRDIATVFDGLARDLAPLKGRPVFVYHPSFGYLFDELGIVQVAVETGGKEPTQRGLSELAARAKKEGATAIFVQAQFPTAAAKTLAKSIGGSVVPMDALAPDWLDNLKRMGLSLRGALKGTPR
ncbi:MAG: zinc ABC transporter substrate-binding protein, partial [Spirochaetaceae bacterium]|nr:zinc ABC transporter substrate-binding protein [Spirochaetaceae bacterium]